MAYHIDPKNKDLVIDGWEQGIADAPEQGIALMKNINLISIPGEANVNFATSAVAIPSVSVVSQSCTFTGATDIITWTPGALSVYTGEAITFTTSTGGVTSGTVYYVANVSGSTFKIYTDIGHTQVVDLSDAGNTFSAVQMGNLVQRATDNVNGYVFFLDANGRAWWVNAAGNLTFLGNTTITASHGNGLCVFAGYLMVFRDALVDYLAISYITSTSAPAWTYGWNGYATTTDSSTGYSHYALTAQDNAMYFCNGQNIQSVLVTGGAVFDPTNSSTYTTTLGGSYALLLPSVDRSTCLAELGTSLLVGGIQNKVYPWDRVSTSYQYPLILGENYTTRMVSTNSNTYIFAGNRGRIYITNASNVQLFKKIPDSITSGTDPYFTWLDAIYWKNQLYFSFLVSTNAGVTNNTLGGLWGIDISLSITGQPTAVALRMTNTLSNGTGAYPYAIAPNIRTSTPAGAGLYIGWNSAITSSVGLDVSTSTPYTDFTNLIAGEIYTDLIPTGTLQVPKTWQQIEFKLTEEMVSGEAVQISYRQSFSQNFTVVGSNNTAGVLSDVFTVNFQNGQWLQLFIQLQSTATTPTYTRLKEVRLR